VADGIDAAVKGHEALVAQPALDSIAAHSELDELGMAYDAVLACGEAGDNPVEACLWPVLRAVCATATGHSPSVARRGLRRGYECDVSALGRPKRHC
jgi:hypothetical protein